MNAVSKNALVAGVIAACLAFVLFLAFWKVTWLAAAGIAVAFFLGTAAGTYLVNRAIVSGRSGSTTTR